MTPRRRVRGRIAGIARYLRTVAHLRPIQIVHRVRLRTQQKMLRRWPALFERRYRHPGGALTWPAEFSAVDRVAPPGCGPIGDLERGIFVFLNETRGLGEPVAWDPPDASQLWLYHQHYWEWAWTLLGEEDVERARSIFGRQFQSWSTATSFGRWNAWAPYPTAIRAWVFVNVEARLVRGTSIEPSFHDMLRLHAGFVEHNLELDVGGNHLIKNLKALVGVGVFFDDDDLVAKAVRHLTRQLGVQVLPDGGHFELSPSYHCQVLADFIDIQELFTVSRWRAPEELQGVIERMRTWLGVMLMPDGDVPLFNDGERVGTDRIQCLRPAPVSPSALTVLPDSGYFVARPGDRIHLVGDVGQPCPPDLPAHAHADCLSFELAIDGARVVVDPGTSVYGSGVQRQWERGTPSHSTVAIDGENQTEVWGAFRAGRLANATLERATVDGGIVKVSASHDGYRHLPGAPLHRRTWTLSPEAVEIDDVVDGTGNRTVGFRLLLAGEQVLEHSGRDVRCSACHIAVDGFETRRGEGPSFQVDDGEYAIGHGARREAVVLSKTSTVELPTLIKTRITLGPEADPQLVDGPVPRPASSGSGQ